MASSCSHLTEREERILREIYDRYGPEQLTLESFCCCLDDLCTNRSEPSAGYNSRMLSCWALVRVLAPHMFKYLKQQGGGTASCSAFCSLFSVLLKGTVEEKNDVMFKMIDQNQDGFISKEALHNFLWLIGRDLPLPHLYSKGTTEVAHDEVIMSYPRYLGLNETSLAQYRECTEYLVLAVDETERAKLLQAAQHWKDTLILARIQNIVDKCFVLFGSGIDKDKITRETFTLWTKDGDGGNASLWFGSFLKIESSLFSMEGEAVHERFQCRGCGQSPIRGTRYTCTVCKHWHMCNMCVTEGREPNITQNHRRDHPFNTFPEPQVIHWGFACDNCDSRPIVGLRHHCNDCADFDLCNNCFLLEPELGSHTNDHTFQTVDKPLS
jgi:hypothetical protein